MKKKIIGVLSVCLLAGLVSCGGNGEPTPQPTIIEKIQLPFTVNATIARYFFDSSDSIEIKSQALVNYDNKFIRPQESGSHYASKYLCALTKVISCLLYAPVSQRYPALRK